MSDEINDAARIVYAIQSIPAGERRLAAVALAAKLFIEGKIPEMRRCQHCWREGVGQHHEACPVFGSERLKP